MAGISILLLLIKFIAYFITHSVAILTDALESIVNVIAGFIGLYSLYIAAKPRDSDHPYGHGKAEFISAAIEGTLIGTAGVFILYKAIHHLVFPVALHKIDMGILLVSGTAAINFVTGYICLRTGRKNNSPALIASGRHLQTDTYSTIGIVAGLVLLYFSNYFWIDSVVALIVGVIIVVTGYKIIRNSVAGIMDEADSGLLKRFAIFLEAHRNDDWVDLHNLRVIKYGSILHVDAQLHFDRSNTWAKVWASPD